MSEDGPVDPNEPFAGFPFFGDLSKAFASDGEAINWEAARQFAVNLANGGKPEPNVDPVDRVRFAELSRIAELQVATSTGLDLTVDGNAPVVVPVTKAEWADRTLKDYRPLLDQLAKGLQSNPPDDADNDPTAQLFGGLMRMVAPMMMAMSAGSMVGHLAERALGAYELPVPRPPRRDLMVVGPNIRAFGDQWSVPFDDIVLWVSIHELLHHGLFSVPHVHTTLHNLMMRFVGSFKPGTSTDLEDRLGTLDPEGGIEGMQTQLGEVFGDPEVLLGAIRSPEQDSIVPEIEALVAVIIGWVDHHLEETGTRILGSSEQLTEALTRRWVTAGPQDQFVQKMLGLDLGIELVERGHRFVSGVVERGGDKALSRLWDDEANLPTPNDVDAPGLWLARIDLP